MHHLHKWSRIGAVEKNPSEMDDDRLLEELVIWVRISRNEGGLKGSERENFRAIVKEIRNRKLLTLYKDKHEIENWV
jgi:hypothetical protein